MAPDSLFCSPALGGCDFFLDIFSHGESFSQGISPPLLILGYHHTHHASLYCAFNMRSRGWLRLSHMGSVYIHTVKNSLFCLSNIRSPLPFTFRLLPSIQLEGGGDILSWNDHRAPEPLLGKAGWLLLLSLEQNCIFYSYCLWRVPHMGFHIPPPRTWAGLLSVVANIYLGCWNTSWLPYPFLIFHESD